MRTLSTLGLTILVVPGLVAASDLQASVPVWDPVAFLRTQGGLTAAEIASVDRGRVMAKLIDTPDRSEILALGIARVDATADHVSARLQDLESRRREPWMKQIGRLEPAALDRLTLDPADVKDLARCRINHCEVRLPAAAIDRFREAVDWASPARVVRANQIFRGLLRGYVDDYRARGSAALFEYANNDDPIRIASSLQALIVRSAFLQRLAPDFYRFLQRFPDERPADVQDVVYWAKERFWIKDILTVNHLTLVERPTPDGTLVLAVSRQLYATHYYESSLATTVFLERGGSGLLVYLDRTRADIRRSGFNLLERLLLKRLVHGRLEAQMNQLKARLEAP